VIAGLKTGSCKIRPLDWAHRAALPAARASFRVSRWVLPLPSSLVCDFRTATNLPTSSSPQSTPDKRRGSPAHTARVQGRHFSNHWS
jgi:hypothetical protein